VGGTKTLCLLVDRECRIIEEVKFKTAPRDGRSAFTRNLQQSVRHLAQTAQNRKLSIVGVGIACAGMVDHEKLKIKVSPNLRCLENYPIGKHLRKILPGEIVIGNDVQLGVYAEHRIGAAVGLANVLGVFFGTGVGGAAIINNSIYRGASGYGGQVGCLLAQPVGGPKAALSHGILDRIASKAAIAGEALAMAAKDWAPQLRKKVGSNLSKVGWTALKRAIDQGDKGIEEMLRARLHVVGIALSNVVNFMNPDMVVLGGGLLEELPKLAKEEIEAGLREYLVPEVSESLKVKPAKLGGAAVALGAALKALKAAKVS
jgi:glucokinase